MIDIHPSALKQKWILLATLGLGLLHGLLYLALVPPWQHNDEPGHFEFAWLIANQDDFPNYGDYDIAMRLDLRESMHENHFFGDLGIQPAAQNADGEPWIGVAQIDRFDLYYRLAAIPLSTFKNYNLESQLYAVRAFSLCLYLVTLMLSVSILRLITEEHSALRWMIPFSLALTPGFTDLMTSANSDVAAIAAFTYFLWASLDILIHGWKKLSIVLLLVSVLLCTWAKSTSLPALAFIFLLPFWEILRKYRIPTLILCALILISGSIAIFSWGDAGSWLRATGQVTPTRSLHNRAPLGQAVFLLSPSTSDKQAQIFQLIPPDQVETLRGRTLTLGAWIWSTHTVHASTPALVTEKGSHQQRILLTSEPTFFSFHVPVPRDVWRMFIALEPVPSDEQGEYPVFIDGVVLALGGYDLQQVPKFSSEDGLSGDWGSRNFVNLIQNGSAEIPGLGINPWIDTQVSKIYPGRISVILGSLLNWDQAGWYYVQTIKSLFNTFWGRFGWGQVALIGAPWSYRVLAAISFAGIAGACIAAWRRRNSSSKPLFFFLLVVTATIWFSTIVRGVPTLNVNLFWPGARYAAVVIVPVFLLVNAGWRELIWIINIFIPIPNWLTLGIFLALFLMLDLLALGTLITYYKITWII